MTDINKKIVYCGEVGGKGNLKKINFVIDNNSQNKRKFTNDPLKSILTLYLLFFSFQNQVGVLNNNNNGNINNNNSQDEPRRKKHEVARPNHILLFTILNPLYPITVVSRRHHLECSFSITFLGWFLRYRVGVRLKVLEKGFGFGIWTF